MGKLNELVVSKKESHGFTLSCENGDTAYLPTKYAPNELGVDDKITVFIYKDSDDNLIGTTETPKILLNQFAYLRVISTTRDGTYLDMGIEKDLFVPENRQSKNLYEDDLALTYLSLDDWKNKLIGSTKIAPFLDQENITVKPKEKVELLVFSVTDMGAKVIINNIHEGLLYENEIYQSVEIGDKLVGYIKKIREDNKIDVSLQVFGFKHVKGEVGGILDAIKANGGFLDLHDYSDPEEIKRRLNISKKTYKKGIGMLKKQEIIRIEKDGVYLIKKE